MSNAVVAHLSPADFEPSQLRGGLAVVIDVLRASSTIARALASGAAAVWPCASVDEARAAAANLPPGTWLLGGERGGVRIDGFDLGNSPAEYGPEVVRGKTIVFTTTNGTLTLRRAAGAARVIVGSLVNLGAMVREASAFAGSVHLLCAGVDGQMCQEDVLGAGAIARGIERETGVPLRDSAARVAAGGWDVAATDPELLLSAMRDSRGGRNLEGIGLGRDIGLCAAIDSAPVVPELVAGRLVLRSGAAAGG